MKIRVKNLSFSYPGTEKKTLDHVSFEVQSGHICAIIGSNGTGKSTLVKCMDGIFPLKEGNVFYDDCNMAELNAGERAAIIGYVPQSNELRNGLTVFDVILSGRSPHMGFRPGKKDIEETERILCRLELEKLAFRSTANLSGGERQRVLIGRAMAQNPKVILLDEPTNNLDLRYQLEIMNLLQELSRKDGMTILTVMHDLNMVLKNCDDVLILHQGKVLQCGRPEEVMTPAVIEDVYGVRVSVGSVGETRFFVLNSLV